MHRALAHSFSIVPFFDIDSNYFIYPFHQLAVVNMSDQYTRIRCGGSALPADAAVMGLLFGNGCTVFDSHEIHQTAAVTPHVELHQAVFPHHQVIGWYRVCTTAEPTPEDLLLTQQLQSVYAPGQAFLFALLTVKETANDKDAKETSQKEETTNERPLSLYQLSENALVAVEEWELVTNPAERVALEHSVRSSEEQRSSLVDLQHAYEMIQERLIVLEEYLLQEGSKNPALLRQIQSLFLSAPVVTSAAPRPTTSQWTSMMTQLATWTKMTDALASYTDKFKIVHAATSRDHHRHGVMDLS